MRFRTGMAAGEVGRRLPPNGTLRVFSRRGWLYVGVEAGTSAQEVAAHLLKRLYHGGQLDLD